MKATMPDTASLAMPELVACEPMDARMSKPACVKLWQSAQARRPEPWEARHHCIACPIGAKRAGKAMPPTVPAQEVWRMCCPRCRRLTMRLIGNRLCASCYNRTLEATKGRNAKGAIPWRVLEQLHPESVVMSDGENVQLLHADMVADAEELIIAQARQATRPVTFGRRAANVGA